MSTDIHNNVLSTGKICKCSDLILSVQCWTRFSNSNRYISSATMKLNLSIDLGGSSTELLSNMKFTIKVVMKEGSHSDLLVSAVCV